MEETVRPSIANSLLAILAGVAATVFAGLILYPLEMLAFDAFFELDFSSGPFRYDWDSFFLDISMIIYFSLSCFAGGFICALVSKANEYGHSLVLGGLALAFFMYVLSDDKITTRDILSFLVTFAMVLFSFIMGGRTGTRIKKRRELKKKVAEL